MKCLQRIVYLTWLVLLLVSTSSYAGEDESKRAQEAVRVLNEIMHAPDKRIPTDLLAQAHAIAVVPDVIKAGFILGGRHGLGLISVKNADGLWSNPSFISMTGGSIGFQAGVQSTDGSCSFSGSVRFIWHR